MLESTFAAVSSSPSPVAAARRRFWRGLAIGIGWLVTVTALKLAFADAIGTRTPFLFYFVGILGAGWIGGLAAGLTVAASSAATGYLVFVHPHVGFTATSFMTLTAYGVEASVLSYAASRVAADRRSRDEARRATQVALSQLELVFGAVEDGITVQNAEGQVIFANEGAARNTGFASAAELLAASPEELAARYEMFSPTGEPIPRSHLPGRVLLQGGVAEPQLIRSLDRKTSREAWWLLRANAVRGEHGSVQFVVNVIQDMTKARAQEEALQVSREWFSTALRSIGDAVIATDHEGVITFVNPIAETLTGWSRDDARGRPLAEVFRIIREDTREPVASPVDRVIAEGVVVGLANHTILIRRDGTEIAIDDSAAPIRGKADALEGVVLVFRDVAAQRREQLRTEFLARATAELNSSLDYTATLANIARLAVPAIADWCAVDVVENGEVRRLAVAHVDQTKVDFVSRIEERYPPDPNATTGVRQILRSGRPELIEEIPAAMLDAAAQDAEHLEIIRALALRSYVGVPLGRGGKTFGALTLVMAESNRRYNEEDLGFALALADRASIAVENARLFASAEQARREAERANRTKDEFLAMLGHELRNPLAPILSTLELLQGPSQISAERARTIIARQVKHLVRLVDDLLDVSRITRGRVEIDRVPVDLADVTSKALEQASPLIEQRNHRVSTNVPPDLVVVGDSVRLAQVFANLITNAAKYTEPGGTIAIEAARDGEWIEVRVRDNGIGIAPDMLGQIFDLFVQAPQSIDRAQGGLGLGLTIVQNLVMQHGGTISARSEGTGRGTELSVRLPAAPTTSLPVAAPSPTRVQARTSLDILVVDDNEDALELLAEMLRTLGHRPRTASHPAQALEVAAEMKPALALLDIGLPGMDGYELARRIREIEGLQSIRLIALTGYGQASDRAKSSEHGFNAHLVKPVGRDQIRSAIDSVAE